MIIYAKWAVNVVAHRQREWPTRFFLPDYFVFLANNFTFAAFILILICNEKETDHADGGIHVGLERRCSNPSDCP